jgi:hypothetical protein
VTSVTIEGELRHDSQSPTRVEKGTVHPIAFIAKDPQMNDALGERCCRFRGIRLPHPDEGEQALAHLARDLASNGYLRAANPLHDRAHL